MLYKCPLLMEEVSPGVTPGASDIHSGGQILGKHITVTPAMENVMWKRTERPVYTCEPCQMLLDLKHIRMLHM